MSRVRISRRAAGLLAVLLPLLALFAWVALRSGPLAPVPVSVHTVREQALTPALFGIGTVQARYRYRIGATAPGRLLRVDVEVGEHVRAGQTLGEIDPVDLDERLRAQQAAIRSAEAAARQAEARHAHASAEAARYQRLLAIQGTSAELAAARRQDATLAAAARAAAQEEVGRLRAERLALQAQRASLRLLAPVDGLVVARAAEPGSTVVAGEAVVEMIDPASLWIDTRFDQISAAGLAAGLPAQIVLRSRAGAAATGEVLRVEPLADAVTEELLAKVVFSGGDAAALPPLGELAEVTVHLPALPPTAVIPNAAVRTVGGRRGVWKLDGESLQFQPLTLGRSDLDGQVQVLSGLVGGERIVLYSAQTLGAHSRIEVQAEADAGEHARSTP